MESSKKTEILLKNSPIILKTLEQNKKYPYFFKNENIDKNLEHPSIIVCSIKNEEKLLSVCKYLKSNGIPFIEFREPDLDNQLTAICLQTEDKMMEKLKLMGE